MVPNRPDYLTSLNFVGMLYDYLFTLIPSPSLLSNFIMHPTPSRNVCTWLHFVYILCRHVPLIIHTPCAVPFPPACVPVTALTAAHIYWLVNQNLHRHSSYLSPHMKQSLIPKSHLNFLQKLRIRFFHKWICGNLTFLFLLCFLILEWQPHPSSWSENQESFFPLVCHYQKVTSFHSMQKDPHPLCAALRNIIVCHREHCMWLQMVHCF